MNIIVAVIAGIIPMLVYPVFLYWMDRYEKEPLQLIGATFLWGFIPAAILSIVSQLIFGFPLMLIDESGNLANFLGAIFLAPVTEEIFKGIAVFAIFWIWRDEFDGVFDGIIYGGLVGFGFAAIENVLYFLDGDAVLFFLRAFVFGLNHAFFTSLTGIGLGVARHAQKTSIQIGAPILGVLGAITVHMVHNAAATFAAEIPALLCFAGLNAWGGVLFVFIVMVMAIRRERDWITEQLEEEVSLHTLSADQYQAAASPMGRLNFRLKILLNAGPKMYLQANRYFKTLTELAYKKQSIDRQDEKETDPEKIDELRKSAAAGSAELAQFFN